ncbi:SMI1/KNR4 family protein [Nocardia sp. NPDC051030]|uniref:SMI1/KNR4 family protein n=1 Tax=Nocardia sp. NPDC051030 TaxID=3155162 RepID=UPI00343D168C
MSPTAFQNPPSDAALEKALRLRTALLDSELADQASIIGCTVSEIQQVAQKSPIPLPDEYLAFLQVMGRKAGRLFRGTSVFFPEPLDAVVAAEDIAGDTGETLTLENRFFFAHHQGYQVFFFENHQPNVYCYVERNPDRIQTLAESFLDWAWRAHEITLELRIEGKRLFESRQQKREAMGLPREEYREI